MNRFTTRMAWVVMSFLLVTSVHAQQKRSAAQETLLRAQYGDNFDEVLDKYQDDPAKLYQVQQDIINNVFAPTRADYMMSINSFNPDYIGRAESEPNNGFDEADDINDVLALDGLLSEYNGKLVEASLTAGDVDVYKFTVDTTKMYYFASTHSFSDAGEDNLAINMRLFHESDLDVTALTNAGGIEGNDKLAGDILGRNTDGRNGSGDFRLTGWVSPINPDTGEKLTGDFYLWVFNEGGETGTYYMTAYNIGLDPWVNKAEPNQSFEDALISGSSLPTDAVVRTYMAFNPDTVKIVNPPVPVQSNSVYPQLLAQGDEDVDHFLINYEAGKTLVIETLPYFGWYRDNDGQIGPGGSRLTDPRIRIYDADYTQILFEDDDGAREQMDGPNNIHSRLVLTPEALAAQGITEDTPLWLWVSAWASQTREPGRSVDNRDPGRFMYDIYTTMYSTDPDEAEPNDTAPEAQSIAARADTVLNASFSGAGDVDMYRVFVNEVRMYTLFTQNSTVSDDIQVEIFREEESDNEGGTTLSENLLTESVAGNAGDNDFQINGWVPEKSGAYLIKLTSASAGDYQLGLVDKGEIYFGRIANEPDDVAEDALTQEPIETGPGAAAETAMIFPAGDVDHYYFDIGAGTDLTLSLSGTNPGFVNDFDVQMTLLDAEFNEIETSTGGINTTIADAGTYIIQVKAVNDTDVGFYRLSGGEPFTEKEGNDTFETANLIALGNIYEAELTSGDTDFYQFPLEAGKLYSFRSQDNETGGALSVEFYDELNGTTLLDDSGWPDNYSGDFKIANIIPRESKTYYLKISGGVGPYKLASRINDDYYALQSKGEPNNSAEEADLMGSYQAFGADVPYVLSDPNHPRFFGDDDWFKVDLTAGQTIVAETKPVGGDVWNRDTDTRLVIWDATAENELVNDDDGGNDWYSRAAYTAEADGPVYVQVRTSRDAAGADDRSLNRGDYWLNIDVTSEEIEPNNDFTTANTLAGGFISATYSVEDADSVDVYSLNLEADHIYHIRTVRPEEGGFGGDFSARLYKASDTSTNLLSQDNMGYNTRYSGSNVKLNIIPDASEEYFLELVGSGDGGYQVALKGRDISELKSLGEPNNTVADADAIGTQEFDAPGETTTYMLYNADFDWTAGEDDLSSQFADDIDIYKYELNAGDTLVAFTDPVDGPLWPRDYDGFMRLLNAAGDTLASDDDGAFDWHSRIEYVAEEAGAYYVMVHGQDWGGSTDRDPSRGEYNLTVNKFDGTPITITDVEDGSQPNKFELDQNYPNPFNPVTTIQYSIGQAADVELTVYNLLGQRVATLVSKTQTAGTHAVQFDATNMASGMYLYRLQAGSHVSVKKMMLVK